MTQIEAYEILIYTLSGAVVVQFCALIYISWRYDRFMKTITGEINQIGR